MIKCKSKPVRVGKHKRRLNGKRVRVRPHCRRKPR